MKKTISIILSTILSMAILLSATGCAVEKPLPVYTGEYFTYAVRTKKDNTKEGYLMGLTELGNKQTELILPREINNIPIVNFGYHKSNIVGDGMYGHVSGWNLKKLYVPFGITDTTWYFTNNAGFKNASIIQWKPSVILPIGKNLVIGYVLYKELLQNGQEQSFCAILANISYMLNYEVAENDNYYWVDSYDNDFITFVPPDPVREGYKFKGWYKEAECLNEWDFATDKTGDEIPIIDDSNIEDYDDSGITYLYAGWEKE